MKTKIIGKTRAVKRKGVSMPINEVTMLALTVIGALFFAAIILPLLYGQKGTTGCQGPMKFFASMIRDLTEKSIC